jgi:siroheme synthase
LVVSGHAEAAYQPALGSLAPGVATVVVLMGLATREAVAALLLARGWSASTPAAIVLSASRHEACAWRGSLDELGACALPDLHPEAPGLLVIGAAVSVAAQLEVLSQAATPRIASSGG